MDCKAAQSEVESEALALDVQIDQRRDEAHALPYHRCKCSAENLHVEDDHEKIVQHYIENCCNRHEHERSFAVPHSPEDCRYYVVAVDEDQTYYAGDSVVHCIGIGFGRSVQSVQYRNTEEEAYQGNQKRCPEKKGKERSDRFLDFLTVPGADITGNQDLTCGGESHGHECQKVKQVSAYGDCAHARTADELTYDYHVHHVVDGLQGIGHEQRKRKEKKLLRNASFGQVLHHCLSSIVHGNDDSLKADANSIDCNMKSNTKQTYIML